MRTDVDMLCRTTDWLTHTAADIDDSLMPMRTPCVDWDVAALLDHVIGGNLFTMNILGGQSAEQALAAARSSIGGATHSGERRVAALLGSAAAQLHAFEAVGVLGGSYHHVAGPLPGEQILRLRIHDMSIHVWDLLQAVNPKKGLDPVYVRWAIDELARPDSVTAQRMAAGFPSPQKPYELLLAFGRRRITNQAHLRDDG